MDQMKFLNVVRRNVWWLVLAAVIAAATTFQVLSRQPRLYEAQTRMLVGPTVDNPSPDLNSLRIGGQLMQTYADLVTTRPLLDTINSKLDQKLNLEVLTQMIETKQNVDTRILTIEVRGRNPQEAMAIANAAAQSLLEISPSADNTTALLRTQMSNQSHQVEQIITKAEASIQELEAELLELGNEPQFTPEQTQVVLDKQDRILTQLSEERARLSDAMRTLASIYQVLLDSNTNQLQIVEPAETGSPIDQNLPLRVAVSALAGLLLALGLIFAREYFDDTIRVPGDINRSVRAPLLSTVERHKPLRGAGLGKFVTFAQPDSAAANGYRTAAAKLLYFIGQRMPSTFLLSSVGSQRSEDAALAAANLAIAFTQAGYRVVLVDAQLHDPVLSELFRAQDKAGLYDMLTSKTSDLRLLPIEEIADLQFLSAGLSSERWSGAMLNSTNVIRRMEELRKEADIILFAGPPASGFAESLTLATHVSGVILIARYGEVHSRMINEVAESFREMNAPLTGIIIEKNPAPFGTRRTRPRVPAGTAIAAGGGASQVDTSNSGQVE